MEKVLTIVIPTYNMEKYLDKCLTSLILDDKELMKQLEVLVINDGSKDRSSEIAHTYQDRYPDTFRVIDKENGNYGSCINRGLKEATGKYIKVLDADDSFDTENFKLFLGYITTVESDMVISDFYAVNEKGEEMWCRVYDLPQQPKTFNFSEAISRIFLDKNLQMHAIAYRRQMLLDMNYKQTEGISYTDQEWTYTPLFRVRTISYFPQRVYKYLIGREGQTMTPEVFKKHLYQDEKCKLRKLKDYIELSPLSQGADLFLRKWRIRSVTDIYRNYLVAYRDIDVNGLKDFEERAFSIDKNLKREIENITLTGTNYKYIKIWLTTHKRPSGLLYNISRFTERVYCHFKR